jgi:hypothetical protein
LNAESKPGWQALTDGFPWFVGAGRFPIPAYSEFMPPPRVGMNLCGELDRSLFAADDPYGWRVKEVEEVHQLRRGLQNVANQVMTHLLRFLKDLSYVYVAGPRGRNLKDNPYWSDELAAHAAELAGRRHLLLQSLALSKTQNDRGRIHWTLFGISEQGPERAFWNSFYTAPGVEVSIRRSRAMISELLASAFGVTAGDSRELQRAGFRILPSATDRQFPNWTFEPLPKWTRQYLVRNDSRFAGVRYLLTFRPFSTLPKAVRKRYLDGTLELLPSPLSLLFWGMPIYRHASRQHTLAIQYAVLRLVSRNETWNELRVPQLGWLRHSPAGAVEVDTGGEVILNEYARTHRWERLPRDADPVARPLHLSTIATTLFSTALTDLHLYGKPMARNCQIWTRDGELILNGPTATRADLRTAATQILAGGLFLYRFQFPPMRVGRHDVYWQRPLVACWSPEDQATKLLDVDLFGYLTAYDGEHPDYAQPVELYPRMLRRPTLLDATQRIDRSHDRYRFQTALNVFNVFDISERWQHGRLPRSFAEQLLRVAQDHQQFDQWLKVVAERCAAPDVAQRLTAALARKVDSRNRRLPKAITYDATATRAYEEAYWQELVTLSHGEFVNKANSDVVDDPATLQRIDHPKRDLFALGEYLIRGYRAAIAAAGMEENACVGELPFKWETDFEYKKFGGWLANQTGGEYERNVMVVIPGKDRSQAVVMGDHYDTAYMEDVYETARGGTGARISAQGADDNASATATLLLAAPIFLKLAKEGKLERDVWLLHLTGEEFPSDCMGARAFCQSFIERTLKMCVDGERWIDLSGVTLAGVLVMDMIAHNRGNARNIFQISPGRSAASLTLAYQAHLANMIWNARAPQWNRRAERKGRGPGVRSADARTLPQVAEHPILDGEVRTNNNPQSSLFNTDVQIFSDIGVPCVLMMENYDINRRGYHDMLDTMENIDLDYGAALSAICIETVARVATAADGGPR